MKRHVGTVSTASVPAIDGVSSQKSSSARITPTFFGGLNPESDSITPRLQDREREFVTELNRLDESACQHSMSSPPQSPVHGIPWSVGGSASENPAMSFSRELIHENGRTLCTQKTVTICHKRQVATLESCLAPDN